MAWQSGDCDAEELTKCEGHDFHKAQHILKGRQSQTNNGGQRVAKEVIIIWGITDGEPSLHYLVVNGREQKLIQLKESTLRTLNKGLLLMYYCKVMFMFL